MIIRFIIKLGESYGRLLHLEKSEFMANFRQFNSIVGDLIGEKYGNEYANTVLDEISKEYETIYENIPYIGGDYNL